MFFPFTLHINNSFLNVGDTLYNFWIFNSNLHKLTTHPSDLFNTNIMFPEENTLAYGDHQYPTSLIYGIILILVQNKILAYNLLYFLVVAASGFTAYLLVKYLTKSWIAGLISGVFFAFFPYRIHHIAHIQLLQLQWLPLSVLFLFKIFDEQRIKNSLLFALFSSLTILSSFYLGFQLFFIIIILLLFFIGIYKKIYLKKIPFLLLSCFLIILMILPFIIPYLEVKLANPGFTRTYEEISSFSGELHTLFIVNGVNFMYDLIYRHYLSSILSGGEGWFTGFLIMIFAFIGFVSAFFFKRDVRESIIKFAFSFMFLFLLIMAFGPTLRSNTALNGMKLPYYFFFKYLPGLKSLRSPSQFALGFTFALCILGGFGIKKIIDICKPNALKAVIGGLLFIMMFFETFTFPLWPKSFDGMTDIPKAYQAIAKSEHDILIYDPTLRDAEINYFASYHFKNTPYGLSGYYPENYLKFMKEIEDIRSFSSVRNLVSLGVNYLIFDETFYNPFELDQITKVNLKDFKKTKLDSKILVELIPENTKSIILCKNPIFIYGGMDEFNYPSHILSDYPNSFFIFNQFNSKDLPKNFDHVDFPLLTATTGKDYDSTYIPSISEVKAIPNQEISFDVLVKNNGSEIWGIKNGLNYALSYKIFDTDEQKYLSEKSKLCTLKKITFPGDDLNFHVKLIAPEKPGKYNLEFDMMAVGKFRFSEKGVKKIELGMNIAAENLSNGSIPKKSQLLPTDSKYNIKLIDLESLEYELTVNEPDKLNIYLGLIGNSQDDFNFIIDGEKYKGEKIYEGNRLTLFGIKSIFLKSGKHRIKVLTDKYYKQIDTNLEQIKYNMFLGEITTDSPTCLFLNKAFSNKWELYINGKKNTNHFIANYYRNVWFIDDVGKLEIKLVKKSYLFYPFLLSNTIFLACIVIPIIIGLVRYKPNLIIKNSRKKINFR